MKIVNLFKKLESSAFYVMLTLVGLGLVLFNVLPMILPNWENNSSPMATAITLIIGVAAAIFGIRGAIKATTTKVEDMNYFDKVKEENVDPTLANEVRNSEEPTEEFYFHYCGKLNQSYIMETPDRTPVFELNCDKMGLLNDYVYTFKSHVTGKEFTSNVSHTVTTSTGTESWSIVQNSYFKIDDKNIWDYIADMGYGIEPYLETVAWSFTIKHLGYAVGDLKAAGTNILKEYEGQEGLRNIPGEGLFRVNCRRSDVDAVAMIAFAVSRVQII